MQLVYLKVPLTVLKNGLELRHRSQSIKYRLTVTTHDSRVTRLFNFENSKNSQWRSGFGSAHSLSHFESMSINYGLYMDYGLISHVPKVRAIIDPDWSNIIRNISLVISSKCLVTSLLFFAWIMILIGWYLIGKLQTSIITTDKTVRHQDVRRYHTSSTLQGPR